MNSCTFAGRVGGDAEIRKTGDDQSVANFSLAVDRPKKRGEKQSPIWIKVTLWGKTADNLTEYITKGKVVSVTGAIDLNTYKTRNDEERTELVLNARDISLLGGGSSDREPGDESENRSSSKKSKAGF
jgi:single-strand DNA-binding protein